METIHKPDDRVIYVFEDPLLHRIKELMATILAIHKTGNYKIKLDNGEVIDHVDWIRIRPLK